MGRPNFSFEPGVTTYGKLTVLKAEGRKWYCRCECGREKWAFAYNVRKGDTSSCGEQECKYSKRVRHGMHGTHEYECHRRAKHRGKSDEYAAKMCRRWSRVKTGFTRFLEKMGKAPSKKHSLDRIDNNGNYSCGDCSECKANGWPFNCRWATPREQANNRSTTVMVTWKGKTQAASYWEDELGFPHDTIAGRIRAGWSVKRAMTEPSGSKVEMHTFRGVTDSLPNLCKTFYEELGVSYELLQYRLRKGWSVKKALTTPVKKYRNRKGS